MVKKIYNFDKIIAQLISMLSANGVNVERVILYGSQADGTSHDGSDIDIVVISRDFARYEPLERLEFLSRIAWKCEGPLEVIGYTPDEVKGKENESIFWDEITKTGIEIYKKAA